MSILSCFLIGFDREKAKVRDAALRTSPILLLLVPVAVGSSMLFAAVPFVFLPAPLAAHAIGRSAFALGVPLFPGTKINEMPRPEGGSAEDPDP